jgi:hypothetical protein
VEYLLVERERERERKTISVRDGSIGGGRVGMSLEEYLLV